MDKRLKAAIDQLDILSVKRYISDKVPLYNISLSYVIETFGPANEEILWGYESREGDIELLRDIDRRKAVIVSTLLDHDVTFDDDCLHHCYTFRCPRTAKVLLANGINPNRLNCGTESALQLLRTGRDVVGFNDASEILLKEMERALLDYGAVEFEKREYHNLDKRPLMVVMMGLQGSGNISYGVIFMQDLQRVHLKGGLFIPLHIRIGLTTSRNTETAGYQLRLMMERPTIR